MGARMQTQVSLAHGELSKPIFQLFKANVSWVSVIIHQLVLAKFRDKNTLPPDLLILPAGGISRNPQRFGSFMIKPQDSQL